VFANNSADRMFSFGFQAIKEQIQATNEDKFQIKINAFSVAESFNKSLLIHVSFSVSAD
jgi:hypothetical protein